MEECNALVSIIVPVYGTEAYLPACVDSICEQSYENIQIILVDDNSPDRCPEICDDYAQRDSRIAVIHQENKGVSGARNAGLCNADGDYIMFVDSDDELHPDAVEVLLNDAREYKADIVSAKKKLTNELRDLKSHVDHNIFVYKNEESLVLSLRGNRDTNSVCAKLFKSTFIEEIRFEEGKNINEDGFFMFQCYAKKPVLVQHNVNLYQYNSRPNSASRQRFSDKYFSMLYFCERKKKIIADEFPEYIDEARNMEIRTHLQFLQVLCGATDKKYKEHERASIETVKRLYRYHRPINDHHKKLAWIVAHGLYSIYKRAIRWKYYR